MTIARIFTHVPQNSMFDVNIGDIPLSAATHSWRSDGFVLIDGKSGPYIPFENIALIMTYDSSAVIGPAAKIMPFALIPSPPKEPA